MLSKWKSILGKTESVSKTVAKNKFQKKEVTHMVKRRNRSITKKHACKWFGGNDCEPRRIKASADLLDWPPARIAYASERSRVQGRLITFFHPAVVPSPNTCPQHHLSQIWASHPTRSNSRLKARTTTWCWNGSKYREAPPLAVSCALCFTWEVLSKAVQRHYSPYHSEAAFKFGFSSHLSE